MTIPDLEAEKRSIRQTTKRLAISSSSQIDGAMNYLCEDVLLLPPNGPPIKGIKAAKEQMIKDSKNLIRAIVVIWLT